MKRAAADKSEIAVLERELAAALPGRELEPEARVLERYADLVRRWNRRGNLVSRADQRRVVTRHVVESILAVSHVECLAPRSLIDLGSGGGFPGIPIAILYPRLLTVLVESRRLKSVFLLRAIRELSLARTFVWCERAENLGARARPDTEAASPGAGPGDPADAMGWSRESTEPPASFGRFDLATARAIAPLAELARWAAPLVREGGHLLAYKGSRGEEELEAWRAAPGPWKLAEAPASAEGPVRLILLRRAPEDVSRGTQAGGGQ